MPNWAEQLQAWTALGSLLIASGAAFFLVLQLKQASLILKAQNTSQDMASVLTIWARLDEHWVRYRAVQTEDGRKFEFGQLVSYYELACSLFRDKVFTTRASRTLHEHLHEILPNMRGDINFKKLMDDLRTDDTTFENIAWFCKKPPPRSLEFTENSVSI